MQMYCELPFLSDQVWVQMTTVVKIVLLMDHSLVKGIPFDKILLIIPVHFVHPLCQIEKDIDKSFFTMQK